MRELFVSHYKEHFSSVTCVSNLDVYPTNKQTILKKPAPRANAKRICK